VISRSCVLDSHRKHLLVAPVIRLMEAALLLDEGKRDAKIAEWRADSIPHFFHLPQQDDFDESLADLSQITPLHRTFLDDDKIEKTVIARLSTEGTAHLQAQLGKHLGGTIGFDHRNEIPQSGIYRCTTCFYRGLTTVDHRFEKGAIFGPCPQCGEDASFVKMASQ
jgi:hypothetical protein